MRQNLRYFVRQSGVVIPIAVAKDTQWGHVKKRALMVNFDMVCVKIGWNYWNTRAGWTGWCSPNRFWTQEGIPLVVSELCHRQSSKCKNNPNVAHDTLSQYGDHYCEIVVKSYFKKRSYGLDTIVLQGHAVTLTHKQRHKCFAPLIASILWSFLWNIFQIRLQITKLWAGHDFAARSCCDFDLQGSNPNVASDTSSQYGDHFCDIVLKSDFK
jgi:hypothetical protein